jgi:hypothetical protein
MPTPTYTPLATVTLGSAAASVAFSSIPATYRDLILIVNGTTDSATGLYLRFNGDTGSNYFTIVMDGLSSGASSAAQTGTFTNINYISNILSTSTAQIMDYSATDKHKTILGRGNAGNFIARGGAARWANTAAITSLVAMLDSGRTYAVGTSFSLYGVIA